jgi:DNA-directed RNA polymerase specialized sigma24 family protein
MAENNLRDAIRGLTRQKRGGNHVQQAGQYGADLSEGLALLAVTTTTPSHTARHDERVGHLQAAISRLPADYARVVHLLDLEGQSIAQAASAMNRSAGAVHMLRARAYDRLIALLGPASAFFSEP